MLQDIYARFEASEPKVHRLQNLEPTLLEALAYMLKISDHIQIYKANKL